MSVHRQRGSLLYYQGRYRDAEKELRRAITEDPGDGAAHALLALCLAERTEWQEAAAHIGRGIAAEPWNPFLHYANANILRRRNRPEESLAAITAALQLAPRDPAFHAERAAAHLDLHQWQDALDAADEGLTCEAEHAACTNIRAMALTKLGRGDDARATVAELLGRNPQDAFSHANQGWTCLHQSRPDAALEHFREALKLDPNLEWARAGLVETLKARYRVYGWMLRYFLWMSSLSSRAQWGVILGGYFGYRILDGVANSSPALKPWIMPFLGLYILFAILTWIASPLFNLLLRFDRDGRYALSRDQRVASHWVGAALATSIAGLSTWFLAENYTGLFIGGAALMMIPALSSVYACEKGWPRRTMAKYTAALGGLAALTLVLAILDYSVSVTLSRIFVLGAFLSSWVANACMTARPRL